MQVKQCFKLKSSDQNRALNFLNLQGFKGTDTIKVSGFMRFGLISQIIGFIRFFIRIRAHGVSFQSEHDFLKDILFGFQGLICIAAF